MVKTQVCGNNENPAQSCDATPPMNNGHFTVNHAVNIQTETLACLTKAHQI